MPVYIAAAAQALVYLWSVPVYLAFRVSDRRGLRFGAGISAFAVRGARARCRRRLLSGASPRGNGPDARFALRVLANLRLSSARLRGRIGLGDAALTAMACGAASALARILAARAERSRVEIHPDFTSGGPHIALQGMASAKAGQIMLAMLRAGAGRRSV